MTWADWWAYLAIGFVGLVFGGLCGDVRAIRKVVEREVSNAES